MAKLTFKGDAKKMWQSLRPVVMRIDFQAPPERPQSCSDFGDGSAPISAT
jgi:hypothetical protein